MPKVPEKPEGLNRPTRLPVESSKSASEARRSFASANARVEVWNNEVLQLDVNTVGLKGSPTWVSRIFSPERDKGEIIGDGANDPIGTAHQLIDRLLAKDLLAV